MFFLAAWALLPLVSRFKLEGASAEGFLGNRKWLCMRSWYWFTLSSQPSRKCITVNDLGTVPMHSSRWTLCWRVYWETAKEDVFLPSQNMDFCDLALVPGWPLRDQEKHSSQSDRRFYYPAPCFHICPGDTGKSHFTKIIKNDDNFVNDVEVLLVYDTPLKSPVL